eukprot:CAMPEP_0195025710 /NCGR_PEP_ID=MMETSP0326_2-20130528/48457_1 /TAXON_ID=2866 ORGANISM="Crypthecodinium cohnii, Strain Seligo" /NCGR_SAMPLE_ID=MMETSP0326_2 /ASSEMBLY_ACC=CAM_ASM_000348 /LENGTH=116 /DNA_ID=CAMNT_0040047227 /DNA_START=47 /DNA_END=393 /DNA_ORIENTATION=+
MMRKTNARNLSNYTNRPIVDDKGGSRCFFVQPLSWQHGVLGGALLLVGIRPLAEEAVQGSRGVRPESRHAEEQDRDASDDDADDSAGGEARATLLFGWCVRDLDFLRAGSGDGDGA